MGIFDYNNFTKDFSGRVRHNLRFIEKMVEKRREDPKQFDISDERFVYRNQNPEEVREKKIRRWNNSVIDMVRSPNNEVYEVTQLLLAMYGMLLIPYEKYKNDTISQREDFQPSLKETRDYLDLRPFIEELKKAGRYRSTYSDEGTVYGFIRHLRNSISHEGIHFLPLASGSTESITDIIFYDFIAEDKDTKMKYSFENSPKQFCVKLTIDQLKDIIEHVAGMYSEIKEEFNRHEIKGDEERYERAVKICEGFLNNQHGLH